MKILIASILYCLPTVMDGIDYDVSGLGFIIVGTVAGVIIGGALVIFLAILAVRALVRMRKRRSGGA